MNISLEDFNALSAERSSRDVRISELERELQEMQRRHEDERVRLQADCDMLRAEKSHLEQQLQWLETDYENVRFENHWMKQYIILSVEKVRDFFRQIRKVEVLAAIQAFVLKVLPDDTPDEQVANVTRLMQLPLDEPLPTIPVSHADQIILTPEAGAQVIHHYDKEDKG